MRSPQRRRRSAKNYYSWPDDKVVELIALYRDSEVLWNPDHPEYSRREITAKAWQVISDTLDVEVEEVRRKTGNLVSQFHRADRKKEQKREQGLPYTCLWSPYPHLVFLKRKRSRAKVESDDWTPEPDDDSSNNQKETEIQQFTISGSTGPLTARDLNILPEPADEECDFRNAECSELRYEETKVESDEFYGFPSPSPSYIRGDSRMSSEYKQIPADNSQNFEDSFVYESQTAVSSHELQPCSTTLPSPICKASKVIQKRDRSDLFGQYVAARLRSLKTEAARNRVECYITDILSEVSRGTFDDAESISDITNILRIYLGATKNGKSKKGR
ncbi:hypothetical protein GE061_016377 [Apolygus lucorum]|uniref:Uncharacterized protein n=1 Tax=Apolygus lucorum TaxID=248454 RepID=A0A6A4K4M2_APOLU|nr:hypothetical protein GE061_016377 [Apolygus lucorum]